MTPANSTNLATSLSKFIGLGKSLSKTRALPTPTNYKLLVQSSKTCSDIVPRSSRPAIDPIWCTCQLMGALVLLVRRQRWHRQHVTVAGPSESFMGAAARGRRRRWVAAASPGHGLPFIAPRQSLPSSEMFFLHIYCSDEINVYALLVYMMNKDAT